MKETEANRISWLACAAIVLAYMIPYGIVNHLPLHRYTVPLVANEASIPFLPWTFFIYISVLLQAALVLKIMPRPMLRSVLRYLGLVIFFSLIFFILVPIEYPRALYHTASPLIHIFRWIDGAGNCFPSLHVVVTVAISMCYMLIEHSWWKRVAMWLWTILVIISVLTTKQHYLLDVVGGLLLCLPLTLVLHRIGRIHQ